jgi:hypothetical protein
MADGSRDELVWHRGARCESGACVEIAEDGNTVLVRSSVHPAVPPTTLSRDEWNSFIAEVKDGSFDLI